MSNASDETAEAWKGLQFRRTTLLRSDEKENKFRQAIDRCMVMVVGEVMMTAETMGPMLSIPKPKAPILQINPTQGLSSECDVRLRKGT